MADSRGDRTASGNPISLDDPTTFSPHPENQDVDLDLIQCTSSSPSSAYTDNGLPLQGLQLTTSPILPPSPINHQLSIQDTSSSESQQEKEKMPSPQKDHMNQPAMNPSDNLRRTALANSQHHPLGTIATRSRYGHLLTFDLTSGMHAYPDMAEDLHDWLELTGWHDVPYRIREINRYRELEALEKQQATIQNKKEELLRSYQRDRTDLRGDPKTVDPPMMLATYNSSLGQHRHVLQGIGMTGAGYGTPTRPNNSHGVKDRKGEDERVGSSKLPLLHQPTMSRSSRDRSASPFPKYDQRDYDAYRKRDSSRTRAEERNRSSPASSGPSRRPYEVRVPPRREGRSSARRPDVTAEHRQHSEDTEDWDKARRRDRDDLVPKRDLEREHMSIGYYKEIDLGQPGGKCKTKPTQHKRKNCERKGKKI
ncbi:hypothetical protein F4810DRAFT_693268 [Camillea tinctor]|nr:hypothetical protein F4810DRAFT_693268 [Camillea tinctor]